MNGWIKLHRQVIEHWIYQDAYYFRAWMYFLIRANHSDTSILIGANLVEISKGAFITSLNNIASDCNMSLQKTRTFLKLLEKQAMIKKESTTKLTKITICNYADYQVLQQTNNKPITNQQQTNNKPATTDKNVLECLENENTVKEEIKPVFVFKNELIKLGVEKQIVEDWIKVRKLKRAANTQTAFNSIKNQIEKSKLPANECIKTAVEMSWGGFKADWLTNLKKDLTQGGAPKTALTPESFAEISKNPDRLKF